MCPWLGSRLSPPPRAHPCPHHALQDSGDGDADALFKLLDDAAVSDNEPEPEPMTKLEEWDKFYGENGCGSEILRVEVSLPGSPIPLRGAPLLAVHVCPGTAGSTARTAGLLTHPHCFHGSVGTGRQTAGRPHPQSRLEGTGRPRPREAHCFPNPRVCGAAIWQCHRASAPSHAAQVGIHLSHTCGVGCARRNAGVPWSP